MRGGGSMPDRPEAAIISLLPVDVKALPEGLEMVAEWVIKWVKLE